MKEKIVIAGGTGFLGSYLQREFSLAGYEVIVVSRSSGITWNDTEALTQALNGAKAVVNLAGKSVNCRYTEANKKEILESRLRTTRRLGELISSCSTPPEIWFNSSTATIYRDEQQRPNDEYDGIAGEGFSVQVAKQWESVFNSFDLPHTRRIAMRISIVLGRDGGVLPVYRKLVRFGLGGKQGSGQQMFSWIHIEDVFGIIKHAIHHTNMIGPINMAAPHPVTNASFMSILRKTYHMPFGMPSQAWMLKLGALIIGTETELILKSRWVISKRLAEEKYVFKFPEIEEALIDLTS